MEEIDHTLPKRRMNEKTFYFTSGFSWHVCMFLYSLRRKIKQEATLK